MERSARVLWLCALVLIAAGLSGWLVGAGDANQLERFEYRRVVMGAPCTIVLYAATTAAADSAVAAAFARLAEVEEALSDYMPSSETRRLPTRAGVRVPIGHDLAEVLRRSREHFDASHGAFDPTVAPVVALWREARRTATLPAPFEITKAMGTVGMQHVHVDENPPSYMADIDGVRLDFGGIGQGYGAAEALKTLRRLGIHSALVDLSGDIAASDAPPGTIGWRVEVPCTGSTISLRFTALTVSGDEFQHVDSQGAGGQTVRHSHIIDPRTGEALTGRTAVVVVAPDAVDADALATSLSVLGAQEGARILQIFPLARVTWSDRAE